MFMTTKAHERILAEAIVAETKRRVSLDECQNALGVQCSITVAQHTEIAEMQHFYNKGRAVHAADVRYQAKKRANSIADASKKSRLTNGKLG